MQNHSFSLKIVSGYEIYFVTKVPDYGINQLFCLLHGVYRLLCLASTSACLVMSVFSALFPLLFVSTMLHRFLCVVPIPTGCSWPSAGPWDSTPCSSMALWGASLCSTMSIVHKGSCFSTRRSEKLLVVSWCCLSSIRCACLYCTVGAWADGGL